jgi:uncharacterized membrane protein YkvI
MDASLRRGIALTAVRVLIVPAGVILSTMFGGGYASGRETATFISGYGPWGGVLAVAFMALVFGVIMVVCLELARTFLAYDYASLSRVFLGRAAVVYEATLSVGLILALGVGATAAGATLEDHFGVPRIAGTALLMLGVIALTFFGRHVVEWSMTISAGLLLAILAALVAVVFKSASGAVFDTFAAEPIDNSFWQGGGLYAVLGASFFPLIIFIARNIETRKEAIQAGMFGGVIVALPALAFHVSFMASYPAILDEDVPSYAIAEMYGSPLLLNAFVLVLFVLMVQTSVGILQGLIERVDAWAKPRLGRSLSSMQHAGLSAVVLLLTVGLSVVGVVNLVAAGYGLLSIAFLFTFTIPLLTIGVQRLRTSDRTPTHA